MCVPYMRRLFPLASFVVALCTKEILGCLTYAKRGFLKTGLSHFFGTFFANAGLVCNLSDTIFCGDLNMQHTHCYIAFLQEVQARHAFKEH